MDDTDAAAAAAAAAASTAALSTWQQKVAGIAAPGPQELCLIFTTYRFATEELVKYLSTKLGPDLKCAHYHAQLPANEKAAVLEAIKKRELRVVVSSCALGLGVVRESYIGSDSGYILVERWGYI
tara:strand:- start:70 stop:444 length:375 start_codon:yes stop_codon:yes gene_type:complete